MSAEEQYIKKRKKQAKRLSGRFKLMQLFPIKENKIVVSTFEGDGGYCCNPRYIVEELQRRNRGYEIVWLTHDVSRPFPKGIKVVQDTPFHVAYHLSTAHVWIDNYRKPFGTVKRKKQLYIQTWHASMGFKAVGLYRGNLFPKIARIVSESDSALADYLVSNSQYCDLTYPKQLLYNGPTIRTGSPRVDCLINKKNELHKEIRERYGIDLQTRLVLFAPTFRGGNQTNKKQVVADIPSLDFVRLVEALRQKFGGQWKVMLRLHPQLSAKMEKMPLHEENKDLIDVSQAPDISEVMAACDLIITDYSSCAFDALFAYIPVLLYADDIQTYVENRGQLMWKKNELPFRIAENNDELIQNIDKFNPEQYVADADAFMKKHGVIEDGHASERVADVIEGYLCNQAKPEYVKKH